MTESPTPYDRMGGEAFFTDLVAQFYVGVASDPPLRALYPEEDLRPAARRLRLFLEQYWGGPDTYQQERGHPRLRMRHAPYVVDLDQHDRWLTHMGNAIEAVAPRHGLTDEDRDRLWDYLTYAADAMVNAV